MRNLKQVKETLNRFFKGSKEISGGLAKLLPYIAIFTTGVVTGSGPLTFAGLMAISASAVEGISAILATICKNRKDLEGNFENDVCFDVCFNLLGLQGRSSHIKFSKL